MRDRQNIFFVHAENNEQTGSFILELRAKYPEFNFVSLGDEMSYGEPVPTELEKMSSEMDAAIVVATRDDQGRRIDDQSWSFRSRQNVWLELGWFWGKIGRRRTLILRQDGVEVPSDTEGVYAPVFVAHPRELLADVDRFVQFVRSGDAKDVAEIVYSNSNSDTRVSQFQEIVSSAEEELWVSGIGMTIMRHTIRKIVSEKISDNPKFSLQLLLPNPNFVEKNTHILSSIYRKSLSKDITTFINTISELFVEKPNLADQIEVRLYSGVMPFVVTASDPKLLGGRMLAETLPPIDPTLHEHERPRFYLRRRSHCAVFERYWLSVRYMWGSSTNVFDEI